MPQPNDYHWDDEAEDYLDEDDEMEPDFDCGFVPDWGSCQKAGSEECDFECPYREIFEREAPRDKPNSVDSEEE